MVAGEGFNGNGIAQAALPTEWIPAGSRMETMVPGIGPLSGGAGQQPPLVVS